MEYIFAIIVIVYLFYLFIAKTFEKVSDKKFIQEHNKAFMSKQEEIIDLGVLVGSFKSIDSKHYTIFDNPVKIESHPLHVIELYKNGFIYKKLIASSQNVRYEVTEVYLNNIREVYIKSFISHFPSMYFYDLSIQTYKYVASMPIYQYYYFYNKDGIKCNFVLENIKNDINEMIFNRLKINSIECEVQSTKSVYKPKIDYIDSDNM